MHGRCMHNSLLVNKATVFAERPCSSLGFASDWAAPRFEASKRHREGEKSRFGPVVL